MPINYSFNSINKFKITKLSRHSVDINDGKLLKNPELSRMIVRTKENLYSSTHVLIPIPRQLSHRIETIESKKRIHRCKCECEYIENELSGWMCVCACVCACVCECECTYFFRALIGVVDENRFFEFSFLVFAGWLLCSSYVSHHIEHRLVVVFFFVALSPRPTKATISFSLALLRLYCFCFSRSINQAIRSGHTASY